MNQNEALKQTRAVLKMREILSKLLPDMEEGIVNIDKYAPLPCSSCIHNDNPVTASPCNRCTSFVPGTTPVRDHRPSDKCHWEPNAKATREQMLAYKRSHGVKKYDQYKKYAPVRCINPKCVYGRPDIYKRGLCGGCYDWLDSFVKKDAQVATRFTFMYKLSKTEEERDMAIELYSQLYTWNYFVNKCYCLPEINEPQDLPVRSLWAYADVARINKEAGDIPTPSKTQLLERITEARAELLRNWLEIEDN